MKRLALAAVFLMLALVVADRWVGAKIEDGKYAGALVPPYWEPSQRDLGKMRRRLEALREGDRPPRVLREWSLRYGWINTPGRAKIASGEEVWINSLGARGRREVAAEPRAGATRVLCFGESFTYGEEVLDGEDWPSRLEAREGRLEVLNFGVSAWGTDQALLRFRDVAPELDHDVAILGIMLENFCRNVNRSRHLYQVATTYTLVKPRFVLTDAGLELVPIPYADEAGLLEAGLAGRLFDDLAEHEYWSRIRALPSFSNIARIRAAKAYQERRFDRAIWTDPESEPYRVTLALLEAFHREALELGAREAFVVVLHRKGDHIDPRPDADGTPYWAPLLAGLESRGIPYVETLGGILELRRSGEKGYVGSHHDAKGNDRVAELVLAHLRERLPELR